MNPEESITEQSEKSCSVKEFFEGMPPGQDVQIDELSFVDYQYLDRNKLILPDISLFCDQEACDGMRLFSSTGSANLSVGMQNIFVTYQCKNCGKSHKIYALWVDLKDDRKSGLLFKYGEYPEFGPPTPPRVVSILGAERDYYFKGRRAENQGLGIAAFAYYRRVVENQKDKIFEEIIRTVKKVDPSNAALLQELDDAKKESQFSKAVESIKQGIPQALLINGHNPLTLLHATLSKGIHVKTDTECLEIATSLRIVLTDLVERMANVLKDNAELKAALSKILQKQT